MNSDDILKDFGNVVGISDMKLDEKRTCTLLLNENDVILINEFDMSRLMISCVLGELNDSQTKDNDTTLMLLGLNLSFAMENGPSIGYLPEMKTSVISIATPINELTPELVQMQITNLIEKKRAILTNLEQIGLFFKQKTDIEKV